MADKEASLLIKIKSLGTEALDRVVITLGDIGHAAKAAFEFVVGQVEKAIDAYTQQEKAVNSLNQTLVQQGIYTKDLSDKYIELAGALEKKSLFTNEEIIQAQSTIQSYLGQTKVTEDLIKATLDLAQFKKLDLNSAAQLVGKTIGTETNAMSRMGLRLREGSAESGILVTKSEKLIEVMKFLTKEMGNQAEAATSGYGKLNLVSKAFDEIYKLAGEKLEPMIVLISKALIYMSENMSYLVGPSITILELLFRGLASTGVVFWGVIKTISDVITYSLIGAINGVVLVAQGKFQEAMKSVSQGAQMATESVKDNFTKTYERLGELSHMHETAQEEKDKIEQDRLKASFDNKLSASQEQYDIEQQIDIARKADKQIREDIFNAGLKDAELKYQMDSLNQQLANEKNHAAQIKLIEDKKILDAQIRIEGEKKREADLALYRMNIAQTVASSAKQLADNLVILNKGNSSELLAIQKALGIAMIIINTEIAALRALSELGPIWGGIAAGVIYAAGATSVAVVASQQMADGGIVKSTSGGITATIGEGGRDEAVIPLEDGQSILGSNVTINVYGGMLGDANSARELAVAFDKELLKLRQSNQSLALPGAI